MWFEIHWFGLNIIFMYYSCVLQAETKAEEAEKRLAVAEKMFSAQSNDVMAKHVSDFIGFVSAI